VATETIPSATQSSPSQQVSSSTVSFKDIRPRDRAQMVIAAGVVLYFIYEAELVLAVMMVSILLAFILSPLVDFLQQFRLPRSLASFISVLLLLGLMAGIGYISYAQASSFIGDLPKYSGKIREDIQQIRQKAERWENSADILPQQNQGNNQESQSTQPASKLTDVLSRGFGSVSETVFAASFVPFLVYFMLSWAQHTRSATVMLFRMENRHAAYVTLGLIAKMMRSFMVGNLLVGLFISALSTIVFGFLHLPFFYFIGPISGYLSLIPYLGVLIALIPPLVVGMGQLQGSDVIVVVLTVFTLHVFSLNVLYPKLLGSRLQLNPLAVTIALLFWGWLWGAMGLILAVPLTGTLRIVFDHVQPLRPFGAWLGE
jgi:predicted PurR-regulated permease PerM